MKYIIIFNPNSTKHAVLEHYNDIICYYNSYEDAKKDAEELYKHGFGDYEIYTRCTDQKNYLV